MACVVKTPPIEDFPQGRNGYFEPKISKVFVSDQDERNICFGMKLETRHDEGSIRHRCLKVDNEGLAAQFGLKNMDDFLLIDGHNVLESSHADVLRLFSDLQVSRSLTLLTRRFPNKEEGSQDNDMKVEYICTKGQIDRKEDCNESETNTVEEEDQIDGLERKCHQHFVTSSSRIFVNDGSNKILIPYSYAITHLRSWGPQGYLRYFNNQLHWKRGHLVKGDTTSCFKVWNCVKFFRFQLISIIQASEQNYFLTAHADDSVTMQERELDEFGFPLHKKNLMFEPIGPNTRRLFKLDKGDGKFLRWDSQDGVCLDKIEDETDRPIQFEFNLLNGDD